MKNIKERKKFASTKIEEPLQFLLYEHNSNMIKRAPGVELDLQLNKAVNIGIASSKINGVLILPGEEFSLWDLVGSTTKRKGYLDGRVIKYNKLVPGTGGGLCNLGHTLHLLVVHSPLTVTEFNKHSDALAPDEGKRVPFSAGTSIAYNYLDFRFKNNTNNVYQILIRTEGEELYSQIRSNVDDPHFYEINEENHCFKKEGNKYFRCSKIYKDTFNKSNKARIAHDLLWDNHSEVMFDYNLIPKNQIKS
ncbi:MAG: VanW family protein [Coriobacteriales bacterium]|nr:VanW family protein [Coriobacteriales bacterium]